MTDTNLHEHLEIDHGLASTYVNVFTLEHGGLIQVIIGRYDNPTEGESRRIHHYNKQEFYFSKEEFSEFVSFFSKIGGKL